MMTESDCKTMISNRETGLHKQANPRYLSLSQSAVYVAGDLNQFNVHRSREAVDNEGRTYEIDNNAYGDLPKPKSLTWYRYAESDSTAVINTFKYIFYKFKKAIFIQIRNNTLVNFLPFSNVHYFNEFVEYIRVDPKFANVHSFINYVNMKAGYRPVTNILPVEEWLGNNAMFRYDVQKYESDNNVVTFKNMFEQLCSERIVPDVDIFFNRRDYPLFTLDGTEPFNHVYGSKHTPLLSYDYDKYCPIFSGSANENEFADVISPTYEDWARAKYQADDVVFPNKCVKYPRIVRSRGNAWSDKLPIAVFRGSSTGAGVDARTNQRLKALKLARDHQDLLDVGITKWNLRPRKYETEQYLKTIELESYPVVEKLTLQEQSDAYKYILCLEGHVAAYRLSYELSSDSVVLLADSRYKMWYNSMLKPFVHYVPVRWDLSDLIDKITWCREHDTDCIKIIQNANAFYDTFLGVTGILDYLQKLMIDVSETVAASYSYLPDPVRMIVDDEYRQLKDEIQYTIDLQYKYALPPGRRCIGRLNGTLKVFRSRSDYRFVKNVFKSSNSVVDLYETNGFSFVRKRALNDEKIAEHKHEAYVGLKTVNTLVSMMPNFAYVYGFSDAQSSDVYVEYIRGTVMFKWLTSDDYAYETAVSILFQLNLALQMAQRYCGFIHYDLYPWNVVIETLPDEIEFDYDLAPGLKVRYRTKYVPVIIDYGKSRSVVYEKGVGIVDHGMVNLFNPSALVDTLTILCSTVKVLADRLYGRQYNDLVSFMNAIGLDRNVCRYSKYGALFEYAWKFEDYNALSFVSHCVDTFSFIRDRAVIIDGTDFNPRLDIGNPIYTSLQMLTGDDKTALLGLLSHMDKSTPPVSSDRYLETVITSTLDRRLSWLNDVIASKNDAYLTRLYRKVRYHTTMARDRIITSKPDNDLPSVRRFNFDQYVTKTALDRYRGELINTEEDWISIMIIYNQATTFDPSMELYDFGDVNTFTLLNDIASNNTALKLYDMTRDTRAIFPTL